MNERVKVREIHGIINHEIDYFLCSASFEERCIVIPQHISECKIKNAIVFCNSDFIEFYNDNEKKILSLHSKSACKIILLNTKQPAPNALEIFKIFDQISDVKNKKYFIDTTTFTHETLLVLFKIITLKEIPKENVLYAYLNASNYSTNEKDLDKKWLSKGIGEIRNVIGYGGFINPIKKNHLIVLVGIELERTKTLIDQIEPNSLSLGVSYDHVSNSPETIALNKQKHEELRNKYLGAESFEFSVLAPNPIKVILTEIVSKHYDCNIIIASMNNKISTIGVGIYANDNPQVQLSYATALQYNIEGYSEPGDDCYLFTI